MLRTLLVTAVLGAPQLAAQTQGAEAAPRRLRNVEARTADVFTEQEARDNPFYWLANTLHATTHPDVATREVWTRRGEPIDADEVAEMERNLRRLGLFGDVKGDLQPVGDDEADLLLTTRDLFSLGASANVAHVGGVNRVSFRLSENNLLGTGKSISATSSHSQDQRSDAVSYFDPQFLGGRHTLGIQTGTTEDGAFGSLQFTRPFRRREDPFSYGIELSSSETSIDYYQLGRITAELPAHRQALRLFAAFGDGPRDLRQAWGIDLRARDADYGLAFGPTSASVRSPGDTTELELGPYWTLDWRPRYLRLQGLDSLDYDEDLALGVHSGLRVAGRQRHETGAGSALEPLVSTDLRIAAAPGDDVLATVAGVVEGRNHGEALAGWRASGALHGYFRGLPAQTLCGSLTADAAFEREDLTPQFTLGEDNGLRGYPAREFAGNRRLRLNLEDRIDTGIEILSVRLGLVAFADAGWLQDPVQDQSLGRALRGVGFGLRFGSSHLFGDRVLRLDFAWPLDDPFDQGYGMSVSFAIGQVFTFFGNANSLGGDF